jgi:4-amino-4-deoxy-L-arabinose transferase-like glycosyltransferase
MSAWLSVLEGLALEALLLSLSFVILTRVGGALLPTSADLIDRIGVCGLLAMVGWVGLLQLLGLLGVLWLPVVIGCLGALAAASALFLPRRTSVREGGVHIPASLLAAALPFTALAIVVTFVAPPLLDDSIRYHIVNAAHILDSGSIRTLPFAQAGDGSATSPGNGSLLLLLAMLPFHNASLSGVPNLLCAGLTVVVMGMLLRELGRDWSAGAVAGLVVVTTWAYFGWQMGSAYDDALSLLGVTAGMTFGLRAGRTGELRWLVLAGLSLGLAMGTKDVYLLPAAAVAVAVIWRWRTMADPLRLAAFVLAVAGLSVVWYVRNWVDAGDPLFPEAVRLGPMTLFAGLSSVTPASHAVDQSAIGALLGGQGPPLGQWLSIAVAEWGIPLAAVVASLPLSLFARGPARVVGWLAFGCALIFLVTPFTGSSQSDQIVGAIRYLLPAVAFGVAAGAAVLPQRWFPWVAAVALATNGVALASESGALALTVLVSMSGGSLLLVGVRRCRRFVVVAAGSRPVRLSAGLAAIGLAVAATAGLQPSQQPSAVQRALAEAGNPNAPVVVMDVMDVQAVLGPQLDVNVVAAGDGPVGAEMPIRDPAQLTARIESLHPAAVVVGEEGFFDVIPEGWAPPSSWRAVGREGYGVVYEP